MVGSPSCSVALLSPVGAEIADRAVAGAYLRAADKVDALYDAPTARCR